MKKSKFKRVGITLLIFTILFVVVKYNINRIERERYHLYTLGKVIKYKTVAKSGTDLIFKFEVNGKEYWSREIIGDDMPRKYIGNYYYVQFQPINPQNCKLLLNIYVSDTTIEVPQIGWRSIPELNQ